MSEQTAPKPPSKDRSSLLWSRISEHPIAQWTVAYVGLAYAIQHAVVLTSEAFEWRQRPFPPARFLRRRVHRDDLDCARQ
jgi:hypothetical protein